MAKVAARGTRVWLDGYALATSLTAAGLKVKQETIDVSAFADSGPRKIVGNFDHTGDFSGLFDAATGEIEPTLNTAFDATNQHYLLTAFGSANEGDRCYERVVRLEEKPIEAKKGQAVLLNFTDAGDGELVRGFIIRSAAVTATGNGTGVNVGASTSGQLLVATFRLLAVSGTGSIALKVQESSDNGAGDAYADVAGLTSGSLTTAGSVARATTTAAGEAWKRLVVSTFSGFTSATILATIGVASGY